MTRQFASLSPFGGLSPFTPQEGGLPLGHDYYVDPFTGDDSFDGSRSAPWATLAPMRTVFNAATGAISGYAVGGVTYTDQHLLVSNPNATARITMTFGPGATINWTAGGTQSLLSIQGSACQMTVYGNGLTVQGSKAGSSNAAAATDPGCVLTVYDAVLRDCADGASPHTGSTVNLVRCTVKECTEKTLATAGGGTKATINLTDCEVHGLAGQIANAILISAGDEVNGLRTNFFPSGSLALGSQIAVNGVGGRLTWTDGDLGSIDKTAQILLGGTAPNAVELTDAFFNVTFDGNVSISARGRSRGFVSNRSRAGGDIDMEGAIIGGKATETVPAWGANASALVHDGGATGKSRIRLVNCVVRGFTTTAAIGLAYTASDGTDQTAAGWDVDYIGAESNSGVLVDADLPQPANVITSGMLLGPRTTTAASDWGWAAGSTLAGAGLGGADIGFPA